MLINSRYEVLEKIGASVWSTVYKVKDSRTGKVYALKLYQNIDSDTLYEKFSAEEMYIVTQIEHPNLVKVYNFGNFEGHIYSLSEFYVGSTLADFKFSPNSLDDLYWIIVQVCYALNELHRRGIIHKDIKPANIMYHVEDDEIKVKVLDYGFSKVDLEKGQQHISGTLPYIAPEVFRGKGATPESDFYALGVTLYKLITGTLPYSLEQLSEIVAGVRTTVFPKFPSELNPAVPSKLEKFVLKLMEKNVEERFPDSFSIISYINRIQSGQYRFSWKYSLINSIQHSSYLVREDYAHQLLEYLPIVKQNNGKIIVITGEEGSDRNSITKLFQYHLLTGEYYLFDYVCTPTNRHPFFALIREFLSSVKDNKEINESLKLVSEEFKRYLDSDESSNNNGEEVTVNNYSNEKKDLALDFSFGAQVLETLSQEKPIIFTIEVGHYLSNDTINFIKQFSSTIKNSKIMIILSLDNLGQTTYNAQIQDDSIPKTSKWKGGKGYSSGGLIHTVHIPILPLNLQMTKEYVTHLLGTTPPDEYCQNLNLRSNGNPQYIREILVDLIEKRILLKRKVRKDEAIEQPPTDRDFNFNHDWSKYELPDIILHNIYNKLSHLSEPSYRALQYLSISFSPLSQELVRFLLDIDDKGFFFLIQDCINNHILNKREDNYYFSYQEAKERLFNETDEEVKVEISKKILQFYESVQVNRISICEGLIKSAEIAKDKKSIRKYSLQLSHLYAAAGNREKAFELVYNVIVLDFSVKGGKDSQEITQKDILHDLTLFQETAELTGKVRKALSLFNSIRSIPDVFEKYYIRGILLNASENFKAGIKDLDKALAKAITGKQRVIALINLTWSYINLQDYSKAQHYLDILDKLEMTLDTKVSYIDRKAVYLYNTGKVNEAIQLMENFKKELQPVSSASYYAKSGSFYNNLGLFYTKQKQFDEAQHYFSLAKNIWEQINYTRSLGLSYNNLGDLALRQGNTSEALDYFSKALDICKPTQNIKCEILTYLNFGEAYLKLGKYEEAENYLMKSKQITLKTRDKPFYTSIIHNLAIAKNKTIDFNNYYQFVEENAPSLLADEVFKITPLLKTYILFLLDIGDYEKVDKLLIKNSNVNYTASKEEEFYYQVCGLVYMDQHKYEEAIPHLHMALTFAERNRSSYAASIINCKLAASYLFLGNLEKVKEALEYAEKFIRKNRYSYWQLELKLIKIRIDMLDEEINLRVVLRELLALLQQAESQHFYILKINIYHYLYLTYRKLKSRKNTNRYRNLFFKAIEEATAELPQELRDKFVTKMNIAYEKSIQQLSGVAAARKIDSAKQADSRHYRFIVKRAPQLFEPWQEHLYELLKLDEIERLKFFIKKMLLKMFAPHFFAIYLSEDDPQERKPFIEYRYDLPIRNSEENERNFKESLRQTEILETVIAGHNALYIPLRFKSIVVGYMVIGDTGELPFTRDEINLAKELRLHLTSLLVRIRDITAIEKNTNQMKLLMRSGNEIFSLKDVEKIEQEMVSFCIDFAGCSRAFLIKIDTFGNFEYQIAMDSSKNILNEYSQISKTVLSEVFNREQPLYTLNAFVDSTLKSSISVQDYQLHSIYCAPIIIEKEIHGLLYLDNLDDKKIELHINRDLMDIFLLQISIALKNAKQYDSLMKKNRELHYLDTAKTEFMAIISHELNTPLTTLQNSINQLKDEYSVEPSEKKKLFQPVDSSLSKIIDKVNDIFSFTKYSLLTSIPKVKIDVKNLLEMIIEEAEILSKSRKMIFHLEVKENLPIIQANWESLYLMIYQIVLNAIRFTKDFGTIQIGARKSTFQNEEIDNKETLVIYVQDNGIGIPAKDLDNIFTPFKELNDLYSHQSGTIEFRSAGLGLGLSTAKRIVELHSGKINVQSKEGEGTTVFIILPFTNKEQL